MKIVYANTPLPKSLKKAIFLAGPTPREASVASWRPEALAILKKLRYDGVVFVPETVDGKWQHEYDNQVDWEHAAMNMSDVIVFWVPRDLETLPGFTTNVEFGLMARLGKCVLGFPDGAPKMTYLAAMCKKYHIPCLNDLEATLETALEVIGSGARRTGGECKVPIHIWRTFAFRKWRVAQKKAGNRLDHAHLEWVKRIGKNLEKIYCFALHVNIWIKSENRNKTNEIIISRRDISSILLYRRAKDFLDTKIVLVKEFRSPAANKAGFIWELPGGAGPSLDQQEVALNEVREEVGLPIEKKRLKYCGTRQLAGTVLTHQAHLYRVALTDSELEYLKKQNGVPHGENLDDPSGERAYTEIWTVREILANNLTDWSNVGMILGVLYENKIPKTPKGDRT